MPMKCQIVTQERLVFEGEIDSIVVRSERGEMCILPGHEPLIAVLTIDALRLRHDGEEELYAIGGGIIKVDGDSVVILANTAEAAYEIDTIRAEEAHKRALEAIEQTRETGARQVQAALDEADRIQSEMDAHIVALRRAKTRLAVARKADQNMVPVENEQGESTAFCERLWIAISGHLSTTYAKGRKHMFARRLGIDLGTVNVTVAEREQVLLHEPGIVAITIEEEKIVAIGQEARDMFGRTPESIEVIRPMSDGVIADYEVTEAMLRYFIEKVIGGLRVFKPIVMITVPYGVTSVERRAVHEAVIQAGAKEVHLIPEPLAAAIGVGLPIDTPTGNLIVNIGGGTSEAAVVAMNGIVAADSVRVGGVRLDEAIVNYVRRKYNLVIGDMTAELAKVNVGAAADVGEELRMEIQGRDQVDGLPKMMTITTSEIIEALQEPLSLIAGVVKKVLERTPPELASDIIDRGMVLTGGSALLRGIDVYLTKETNVPAFLADDPVGASALGASRGLERLEALQRSVPGI